MSTSLSATHRREKNARERAEELAGNGIKAGLDGSMFLSGMDIGVPGLQPKQGTNVASTFMLMHATDSIIKTVSDLIPKKRTRNAAAQQDSDTSLIPGGDNALPSARAYGGLPADARDELETRAGEKYIDAPDNVLHSESKQHGINENKTVGTSSQQSSGTSETQSESTSIQKTTRNM